MSNTMHSSAFRISLPHQGIAADVVEQMTTAALAILRDTKQLHRMPSRVARLIAENHTPAYVTQLLTGARRISLEAFIRLLFVVERETVRRVLSIIAKPFGLDVVPTSDDATKDVRSEFIEAAGACGRAFDTVQRAIADNKINGDERPELEAAIHEAKRQLDDVLRSAQ